MRIRYDPSVDALYIRLLEGEIKQSDEISEGIILDYDAAGKAMGIEILDASSVLGGREMKVEIAVAEIKPVG